MPNSRSARKSLVRKVTLLFVGGALAMAFLIIGGSFLFVRSIMLGEIKQRLKALTLLAAATVDPAKCARLTEAAEGLPDEAFQAAITAGQDYRDVSAALARLRSADPDFIRYAYLFDNAPGEGRVAYLADADFSEDGGDDSPGFGETDDLSAFPIMRAALADRSFRIESSISYDGTEGLWSLSAYAPVVDDGGGYRGMVGLDITADRLNRSLASLVFASLVLLGIGLLILFAVSVILSRSLSRPLASILESMGDLSLGHGDLTQSLKYPAQDELGVLVERMNGFIASIRGLVREAQNAAMTNLEMNEKIFRVLRDDGEIYLTLGSDASDLEKSQSVLARTSSDMIPSLASVNQSIDAMRGDLERESRAGEQAGKAVDAVIGGSVRITEESSKRLEAAASLGKASEDGQRWMEDLGGLIDGLVNDLQAVEETLEVIDGISGNSSLLAMNAAIEAAHAGASGRGFAVVAEEMKKLSESTRENSQGISVSLKAMAARIESAREERKRGGEVFSLLFAQAKEMTAAFGEIMGAVEGMKDVNGRALESMRELESANASVAECFQSIQGGGRIIGNGVERVRAEAEAILKRTREVHENVEKVSGLQEELVSLSEKNRDVTNRLMVMMARFKT